MPLIKVKKHFQITLPSNLRRNLKMAEGDFLEVERHDNELVLKPVKVVHPDQEYFYAEEWQKGEAQADKDIAQGDNIGPFDKIKEATRALKTAEI